MKTFEDVLRNARETGKGMVVQFKETANYEMYETYDACPHCKKEISINNCAGGLDENRYEIPDNLRAMTEETCYSWTEDQKCEYCGEFFSIMNGC